MVMNILPIQIGKNDKLSMLRLKLYKKSRLYKDIGEPLL